MTHPPISPCPLCSAKAQLHAYAQSRALYLCPTCALIHVPRSFHLSPHEEKRRYDLHRNDPGDPAYRAFLARLILPLAERIEAGSRGIDYGCGPGPAVSVMFAERGHTMALYDPFYANDPRALSQHYDFLTCTETAEHFCDPRREWKRITGLVRPGGLIGIMTSMHDAIDDIARWHYARDDTHVAFYGRKTFAWIADCYRMALTIIDDAVVILRR